MTFDINKHNQKESTSTFVVFERRGSLLSVFSSDGRHQSVPHGDLLRLHRRELSAAVPTSAEGQIPRFPKRPLWFFRKCPSDDGSLSVHGLLRVQRQNGGSDEEGVHLQVKKVKHLNDHSQQEKQIHSLVEVKAAKV